MDRERIVQIFFFGFLALIVYFLYQILQPFLIPILWAMLLSFLFNPLMVHAHRYVRSRSLAAALLAVATALIVIIPSIWFMVRLAQEAEALSILVSAKVGTADWGKVLADWTAHLPFADRVNASLARMNIAQRDVQDAAVSAAKFVSQYLATHVTEVARNLMAMIWDFSILIFVLFYFLRDVFPALGFESVEFKVATMPEKHLGAEEEWRRNEKILGDALTTNGYQWEINPGEGAFYGPKIEYYVPDALKRKWQLATIQLDFNMSERFGLKYTTAAGVEAQPVVIHRAILGSLERFIGVLIEHTGGVLPFWLAPEQVRVLSLSEKVEDYAAEIAATLKRDGFRAGADLRNEKLGFKVREAELAKVPYMAVVGEREAAARTISLRLLRGEKSRTVSLEDLLQTLKAEPLPA